MLTKLSPILLVSLGVIVVTTVNAQTAPFTYVIDPSIAPREPIQARATEATPRIGAVVDPKGSRQDFVVDEMIIHPRSNSELRQFLRTYNAAVVDDGTIPALPPGTLPRGSRAPKPEKIGFVVVKVDLSLAPLNRITSNARRLKLTGEFRYPSEESVRLTAIVMEERVRGRRVGIDPIDEPQSVRLPCRAKTTQEHPNMASTPIRNAPNLGYMDAVGFTWLNDGGISVVNAWDRLDRLGFANHKVLLFVIDGGFSPNADFRSTTYQYDFVHDDYDAVGTNPGNCGGPCPWHGTSAFSAAGAVINNRFGAAGTGGQVVEPVLFETQYRRSEEAKAVRTAVSWASELKLPAVINMSFGGSCGFFCWEHGLGDAVKEAANKGVIPIAAAGNNNEDAEDNASSRLRREPRVKSLLHYQAGRSSSAQAGAGA